MVGKRGRDVYGGKRGRVMVGNEGGIRLGKGEG